MRATHFWGLVGRGSLGLKQQALLALDNILTARPKVADLEPPVLPDQDIVGLEVAVDDVIGLKEHLGSVRSSL